MKTWLAVMGLGLMASTSHAEGSFFQKYDPSFVNPEYAMRLTDEDSEFINQAGLGDVKLEFLSYRQSRAMIQEDKACLTRQLRAIEDAKGLLKKLPVPLRLSNLKYHGAGDGQREEKSQFASYGPEYVYLALTATYDTDTRECSFVSSEEILQEVKTVMDRHNAEVAEREKATQGDEKYIREFLFHNT